MSTGKTYVIIVAVENYNEPHDFPKVNYAAKDATDLEASFLSLGYDKGDITLLLNEKATRTTILHHLQRIAGIASEHDRIIFYFAGHGFYENGDNLLAAADAIKSAKPTSCVSINTILGILKKSPSQHKMLFLDSCHSGFEPGEFIREGDDTFMADELIYQFSNEEYCIGFASCKTNQSSISHPKLQNGVWSHYLVKALSGEAKGIYKSGLLFSDALQSYLKENTIQFVKLNTTEKLDQNPIKFGIETDKFIIADINPILERKKLARKVAAPNYAKVSLLREESDSVKSLPGFVKRFHSVPEYVGEKPNGFIQDIGMKLLEDEISEVSQTINKKMRYKRVEVAAKTERGYGTIVTPDFDYTLTIEQSKKEPGKYTFTRRLENIKNASILNDNVFNDIFSASFNTVEFAFKKPIDIEKIVDAIQAMGDDRVDVEYDNADLSWCRINIDDLDYYVYVTMSSYQIYTSYSSQPQELVQ